MTKRWKSLGGLGVLVGALVLSACSPTQTTPQVPAISGAPVVSIASPSEGERYVQGVSVNILARIENAGADIQRVQVRLNDAVIGEALNPNPSGAFAFTITNSWPTVNAGRYTISVSASRADGTTSALSQVTVEVLAPQAQASATSDVNVQATPDNAAQATPAPVVQATNTPAPVVQVTNTPAPASPPTNTPAPVVQATNTPLPPPTSSAPQVRIIQGANVRSGPGTVFAPPIGSLAANATAAIQAVSPDRTWYKIQYYNGSGWVSAQVVEVTGDISALPVDAGPPPPPPTNTPAPIPTGVAPTATTGGTANADLVITFVGGTPLSCGQNGNISITIVNTGPAINAPTRVLVEDLARNQVVGTASFDIGGLNPNVPFDQTVTLNISTFVGEEHTLRVRVDPENRAPETNESNNENSTRYTLASGSC